MRKYATATFRKKKFKKAIGESPAQTLYSFSKVKTNEGKKYINVSFQETIALNSIKFLAGRRYKLFFQKIDQGRSTSSIVEKVTCSKPRVILART